MDETQLIWLPWFLGWVSFLKILNFQNHPWSLYILDKMTVWKTGIKFQDKTHPKLVFSKKYDGTQKQSRENNGCHKFNVVNYE